jgi:hypothetical protein
MNIEAFKSSISLESPPPDLSPYLKSLWYDAKENWDTAHSIIQDIEDRKASWIHAYLHRKEGDHSNADYWYYKAGKERPDYSLSEEWNRIVSSLINASL